MKIVNDKNIRHIMYYSNVKDVMYVYVCERFLLK